MPHSNHFGCHEELASVMRESLHDWIDIARTAVTSDGCYFCDAEIIEVAEDFFATWKEIYLSKGANHE